MGVHYVPLLRRWMDFCAIFCTVQVSIGNVKLPSCKCLLTVKLIFQVVNPTVHPYCDNDHVHGIVTLSQGPHEERDWGQCPHRPKARNWPKGQRWNVSYTMSIVFSLSATACSTEGFAGVDWRGTATWMLFQQFPCSQHRIQNQHIAKNWYKSPHKFELLRIRCKPSTVWVWVLKWYTQKVFLLTSLSSSTSHPVLQIHSLITVSRHHCSHPLSSLSPSCRVSYSQASPRSLLGAEQAMCSLQWDAHADNREAGCCGK